MISFAGSRKGTAAHLGSEAGAGGVLLTGARVLGYEPATNSGASSGAPCQFGPRLGPDPRARPMKIKNSLKALKGRHRDNRMVRRKGRIYIINKSAPRYKARQG